MLSMDTLSLAHTKWRCKYHLVFGMCQEVLGKCIDLDNS